jgi:hypothetical protein
MFIFMWFSQVNQILGNQWRLLSAEEKAKYEAEADKDRNRYLTELAALGQSELLYKRHQEAVDSGVRALKRRLWSR